MILPGDLRYYVSEKYFSGEITPLRIVELYEIELITTDWGISIINGQEYPHKNGNLLVAIPGDKRCTKNKFECHSVKFMPDENDDIIPYLKELAGVTQMAETGKIEKIFNEIYGISLRNQAGKSLYLDAKIRELTAVIYQNIHTFSRDVKYKRYVKSISLCTKFIQKNSDKHLSLRELAATVSLSPSFFHSVFKGVTGKTPYEYLTECRIGKAELLLGNSALSIEEISAECGFSSRQYFDTVFKKQIGKTPSEYRKTMEVII